MFDSIKFDTNCDGWFGDAKTNESYLDVNKRYVLEKFQSRGYIYLNEIYGIFGVDWDPHRDNECFIVGEKEPWVTYEPSDEDSDEFIITIRW